MQREANWGGISHNKMNNSKYLPQDIAFLRAQNNLKPTRQPEKLISKWIQGRRIMPNSSPFPGIYDINKTPYIIEFCDNMSPYSKCVGQAVKKGVQIAVTTAGENVIAYYIGERPKDIMYLTGTEDLFKKFNTKRLDPLIDSCGMRHLISPQTYKKTSRKTGDTIGLKQFRGGSLVLGSLNSSAHARSDSIQIMIIDEIDSVGAQMSSGEGNILRVLDGRLVAFGDRAKSFSLSTPREYNNSLIDIQYNRGDKRKYFVPCPFCKKEQWLFLGDEKSENGLKGDYKAGVLQQGYYQCYHCRDAIFDGHKEYILAKGVWLPTVSPAIKDYRSYHLPSFYSPPGMMTFTKMRQEYDEAINNGDDGMRSFTNLYLGKSFRPSGQRPKFESVIEIRNKGYQSGTVPRDIMFLTCSVDVQKGMKKYWDSDTIDILKAVERIKKRDPLSPELRKIPRLEVEVVGHGARFRTASIIYKQFFGRIDDDNSGAWAQLTEWIEETGLKFKRSDGFEFGVQVIFIDSGHETDLVYQYCEPLPMTYAIKGDKVKKEDKLGLTTIDEMQTGGNVRRFNLSKSGAYTIITINTNYYKGHIYRLLNNRFNPGEDQPPNSHTTPSDYPDHYFKGLTAEEHKTDGTFHNRTGRSNEPLDLLVYNKAAADFMIEGMIEKDREVIKHRFSRVKKPLAKETLRELVNRKTVTDRLEKDLRQSGW